MTTIEQEFRKYAGRIVLNGNPSDLLLNIPSPLISKLSPPLRNAFDYFIGDYLAHDKTVSSDRILKGPANGDAGEMVLLFSDLIKPEDIPPMPDIEKRIKEGVARFIEANPQVVSATDFLAETIAETPMVVPPFFPDPGRLYVIAFSGVGKTNLALNMGGAISAGREFLGWQTQKKTVLFIDGENPRAEIQKRARGIFKALMADARNVHFVFPTKRIDLLKDKGLKELERMITGTKAGVVFLDSFLNFFPVRNENDASEVRPALDRITAITRSLSCSVVVIDHTTKPIREARGKGAIGPPTPRGTGAKVDWSDATIALEERKAEGRILRTLFFTKVRTCAPIPPSVLELDGRLVFTRIGEDALVPVERVVEVVRGYQKITSGKLLKEVHERTNGSERSIYRAVDRAVKDGHIAREEHGNRVNYSIPAPILPYSEKTG